MPLCQALTQSSPSLPCHSQPRLLSVSMTCNLHSTPCHHLRSRRRQKGDECRKERSVTRWRDGVKASWSFIHCIASFLHHTPSNAKTKMCKDNERMTPSRLYLSPFPVAHLFSTSPSHTRSDRLVRGGATNGEKDKDEIGRQPSSSLPFPSCHHPRSPCYPLPNSEVRHRKGMEEGLG